LTTPNVSADSTDAPPIVIESIALLSEASRERYLTAFGFASRPGPVLDSERRKALYVRTNISVRGLVDASASKVPVSENVWSVMVTAQPTRHGRSAREGCGPSTRRRASAPVES